MESLTGKVDGVDNLPAAEWNQLPQEVQNVITTTGRTLSSGDTAQLVKSIAEYVARGNYYIDSGAANVYVLAGSDSLQTITSYEDGAIIRFIADNANAGASTINVAGLGVKSLTDEAGASLVSGDISASAVSHCYYNSAGDRVHLVKTLSTANSRQYTFKTADETVTNNNSVQDDDHMNNVLILDANTAYTFETYWSVDQGGGVNGGLKWELIVPTGTVITTTTKWTTEGAGGDSTNFVHESQDTNTQAETINQSFMNTDLASFRAVGQIKTSGTSGTLGFRWSQANTNATGTTIEEGSWMSITRLGAI